MVAHNTLEDKLSQKLKYLNYEDAKIVINVVFNYLKNNLFEGNRIEVRGFGSFSIRERKYAGTDKTYKTIYYRMSKNVLERLNNKKP